MSANRRPTCTDPTDRRSLVEQLDPLVQSLCRRLAADPEDAAQGVWERVFGSISRFDPDGSAKLSTWVRHHRPSPPDRPRPPPPDPEYPCLVTYRYGADQPLSTEAFLPIQRAVLEQGGWNGHRVSTHTSSKVIDGVGCT